MPHWTKEQQQAIDESGQNIIVSAGAGSGKTAVLTERVIQKLKHGEDVSKLLILTFILIRIVQSFPLFGALLPPQFHWFSYYNTHHNTWASYISALP